jgi:hypothetical protein
MRFTRGSAFIGGVVCALVVGGGTAVATNGTSLLIGHGNVGTAATGLANSKGTPLSLAARKGWPPLRVNNTVKVKNLDSDLLDGKSSSYFLPAAGTAADSSRLDGRPGSAYLASTGTAADSTKLGGQPAADYVATVYAAQTFSYVSGSTSPSLSLQSRFDTLSVPAGTYLVALVADLANTANAIGEFGCHVQLTDAGGVGDGEYGNVGVSPSGAGVTFASTAVSQVLTLTSAGSIYAYCYANAGDTAHTSYVYNSTLSATRLQSYVGPAEPMARQNRAAGQPKAIVNR